MKFCWRRGLALNRLRETWNPKTHGTCSIFGDGGCFRLRGRPYLSNAKARVHPRMMGSEHAIQKDTKLSHGAHPPVAGSHHEPPLHLHCRSQHLAFRVCGFRNRVQTHMKISEKHEKLTNTTKITKHVLVVLVDFSCFFKYVPYFFQSCFWDRYYFSKFLSHFLLKLNFPVFQLTEGNGG